MGDCMEEIVKLAEEIAGFIESDNVVGLATHRHYPHERMIYSRFGRCGFAVDVVKQEGGKRVMYSILVEAFAIKRGGERVRSFTDLPGEVVMTMARIREDGIEHETKRGRYDSVDEFFKAVEYVRQAFYRKYKQLKATEEKKEIEAKIGEEIFHQVGLTGDELHLGV